MSHGTESKSNMGGNNHLMVASSPNEVNALTPLREEDTARE
jgi:hypothetical protein